MKICSRCKKEKENTFYCKDSKSKDGLQSQCKSCKNELVKEYYKHNPRSRCKKTKEQILKGYYRNRVHNNVARMIRKGLNGVAKSRTTFDGLGYSLNDLKNHLESQFIEGMTWNNYGEWHIDHIIPRSSLPYESMEDVNFLKCWSLTNLQPLWARDNILKSNNVGVAQMVSSSSLIRSRSLVQVQLGLPKKDNMDNSKLLLKMKDLMIQARTEESHFYTSNVLEEAIKEIERLNEEVDNFITQSAGIDI